MSSDPGEFGEVAEMEMFGQFMERLAVAVEVAGAQVAEALMWNAHATRPDLVPCPHTMKRHQDGEWR